MAMSMNDNCLWTAWGDVVCRGVGPAMHQHSQGRVERFYPQTPAPGQGQATAASTCQSDADCGQTQVCVTGPSTQQVVNGVANGIYLTTSSCDDCVGYAGQGCTVGKKCSVSSDCAAGLSCQSAVCTVGSVLTGLNNSGAVTKSADGSTIGQDFEAQRQAYMAGALTQDQGVRDCAMFGTCPVNFPCDGSGQCMAGLMCDGGVCKSTYSDLWL